MPDALPLIILERAELAMDGKLVVGPLSFKLHDGEIWQIRGSAGTGKSLLLELLFGRHRVGAGRRSYPSFAEEFPDAAIGVPPRFALRLLSQQEQRRVATAQSSFYQARWHSQWTESLTVDAYLSPPRVMGLRPYEVLDILPVRRDFDLERERCLVEMDLHLHRTQCVGQLSNGELRKLLLVAAHLAAPKVMLLDDPLGGLDPKARALVCEAIRRWCAEGQTLVFSSTHDGELGDLATRHLSLPTRKELQSPDAPAAAPASRLSTPAAAVAAERHDDSIPAKAAATGSPQHRTPIVSCNKLRVIAGDCLLLDAVDWQIRAEEHWMISGKNGAGKSTLLALLMGDHPQAYSNDIELLGGRLGHGISLWDRKRSIGFVAPELGWHYPEGWRTIDVVLSGYDASVGIYREPTPTERDGAVDWLGQFRLAHRGNEPLACLSEGERRLTFLARAMVHHPRLLLLDEPTQDLSANDRHTLFAHLDRLAQLGETTVVLVTHHVAEHPRCITHHLQLDQGRVAYSGLLTALPNPEQLPKLQRI